MVNFDSIKVGLEVEFKCGIGHTSAVHLGTVRYKGSINGKEGNWVGVEAKEPVGYCDGYLMGRHYFTCQNNYGLFLNAEDMRLVTKTTKRSHNFYKSINPKSEVEEHLFKKNNLTDTNKINSISQSYLTRANTVFDDRSNSDVFGNATNFVSSHNLVFKPKSNQAKKEENLAEKSFHPISSIPKMYMPHDELKLYTKLNWSYKNVALPRSSTSLNNTFDSFNKKRTNYIGLN